MYDSFCRVSLSDRAEKTESRMLRWKPVIQEATGGALTSPLRVTICLWPENQEPLSSLRSQRVIVTKGLRVTRASRCKPVTFWTVQTAPQEQNTNICKGTKFSSLLTSWEEVLMSSQWQDVCLDNNANSLWTYAMLIEELFPTVFYYRMERERSDVLHIDARLDTINLAILHLTF